MDRIHRHKADGGIPELGENLCYPTLDKTINRGFRRFQGFFTAFDPISGFLQNRRSADPIANDRISLKTERNQPVSKAHGNWSGMAQAAFCP